MTTNTSNTESMDKKQTKRKEVDPSSEDTGRARRQAYLGAPNKEVRDDTPGTCHPGACVLDNTSGTVRPGVIMLFFKRSSLFDGECPEVFFSQKYILPPGAFLKFLRYNTPSAGNDEYNSHQPRDNPSCTTE